MKFIGIWFNMVSEVCRDTVSAKDANEASAKIHAKYNGNDPAPCLTVIPEHGYGDSTTHIH